jgi:hypothetical protein
MSRSTQRSPRWRAGWAPARRRWVRQAQVDAGDRPGTTTEASEEVKRLRRENAELRRANEILKAASAFFPAERASLVNDNSACITHNVTSSASLIRGVIPTAGRHGTRSDAAINNSSILTYSASARVSNSASITSPRGIGEWVSNADLGHPSHDSGYATPQTTPFESII